MSDHGTYARYQKHIRQGDTPCAPCRSANRAYMRKYRAANPGVNDAYNGARSRALNRLARLHPTEFRLLLAEERQ